MRPLQKMTNKPTRLVRLRLTIALPAIVTLLSFGAGILAVNLCKLTLFNPFGKLRPPPYSFNHIYWWVTAYALFCGILGFLFAYFILSRPIRKGLEALETLLPPDAASVHKAETETILLSQALANLYPTLGRLKMTQSLLEALQGGILWVGPKKNLLYANQKALHILGVNPEDKNATGTAGTLTDLTRELVTPAPILSIIEKGIEHRQFVTSEEVTVKTRGGYSLNIGMTSSPIGSGERFEGVLLSFRELSEIHKLQRDLAQLDRLSAIGRLASGLVHEIRNPLASLMGLVEILKDAPPDSEEAETRALIDRIYQIALRIQRLLSEVLDFAGPTDLSIRSVALIPLLDQAIEETRATFQDKNFHLIKDFPPGDMNPMVQADSDKLRQALANILRNAMEAVNEDGVVQVTVAFNAPNRWLIDIFNTGSVIPEEDMEKIFDPFYTTKARGTGLGLPIAKELITLQGGELFCESDPAKGVSFHIEFPGEEK